MGKSVLLSKDSIRFKNTSGVVTTTLTVNNDGNIDISGRLIGDISGDNISTPMASSSVLGGVKINGNNLSIDGNGVLSVSGNLSQWATSSTDIYYTGNVGIGTETPNKKLEVVGDISCEIFHCNNIQCRGVGGNNNAAVLMPTNISASSDWYNGGSDVQAAGWFEPFIMTRGIINCGEAGGSPAAIYFGKQIVQSDGSLRPTTRADEISLVTNGDDRLTIISNGKVGIGTQTPNKQLEVIGDISANEIYIDNVALGDRIKTEPIQTSFKAMTFDEPADSSTNYFEKPFGGALSARSGTSGLDLIGEFTGVKFTSTASFPEISGGYAAGVIRNDGETTSDFEVFKCAKSGFVTVSIDLVIYYINNDDVYGSNQRFEMASILETLDQTVGSPMDASFNICSSYARNNGVTTANINHRYSNKCYLKGSITRYMIKDSTFKVKIAVVEFHDGTAISGVGKRRAYLDHNVSSIRVIHSELPIS